MKRLILILILIIFTSCDPGVVNRFVVENRTESNIKVESILKYGNRNISDKDSIKTVELKPNSELLIVEYGEIGTAKDKGVDFLEGIDTIIVTKEKEVLNKNIFDRINWEFKILNSGILKMNEVEYKIILTERDFK
ncbi:MULTISPECIES: hypothetical protein [unclassified Flavobacterium]|uniref:hypothetical protein n=1 Tax=unclassified Flavobacterium TaxID=196869 RepID=UPI0012909734|nr:MULTISPECIES: hypothetical protein [unclassified Flavobacterium]MQP53067.1 hypothetical protein [Flavobacterium sp. LMO9]MQP62708.1 hypothetical protein [Flavobacterium sp. LMO6]